MLCDIVIYWFIGGFGFIVALLCHWFYWFYLFYWFYWFIAFIGLLGILWFIWDIWDMVVLVMFFLWWQSVFMVIWTTDQRTVQNFEDRMEDCTKDCRRTVESELFFRTVRQSGSDLRSSSRTVSEDRILRKAELLIGHVSRLHVTLRSGVLIT